MTTRRVVPRRVVLGRVIPPRRWWRGPCGERNSQLPRHRPRGGDGRVSQRSSTTPTPRVSDANDLGSLSTAFQVLRDETERPTIVIVESRIDYGAPGIVDTSAAHGKPLGAAETKKAKASYSWPEVCIPAKSATCSG